MTSSAPTATDELFDRLPIAVFRTDRAGRILAANPALCGLLGYGPDELSNLDVHDLYVDRSTRDYMIERVVAGEHVDAEEIELIKADGSRIWVRAWSRAVFENGVLAFFEGTLEDISDRRRIEMALRDSELLFRLAFEYAPHGLVIHDPDGTPLRVNRAVQDMVGRSAESIVGTEPFAFVHEEELEDARARLQALRSGEIDTYQVERRIPLGDGSHRHALVGGAAIRTRAGEFRGFITQIVDITPRKLAEMRLAASEALFRSTFENAPIGMAITAPDGSRLEANPALCRLLGVTLDEFRTSRFSDHLSAEDVADATARMAAMSDGTGDDYTVERRLITSSGESRWVRFFVSPVRDDERRLLSVLTQIEDATEERAVLEALERRGAENAALIAAIPDMLFRMNREGRFLGFKPAATFDPAISPDAFIGKTLLEAFPDWQDVALPAIHAALSTGEPQHLDLDVDSPNVRGLFELIVNPMASDEVLVVVRDITERVRAKTQLEQLLRSKDELIASVSHELRTPLTTVVGLATELRSRFDEFTSEERRDLIGLIADQGAEMADLIDDLLVAARADVGMIHLQPASIDVRSEVAGTIATAKESMAPAVRVEGGTTAWADPFRVRQIMRNLLTNAVRYGEEPIEIAIRTELGACIVDITDAGAVLPEDRWEHIFDPYYSAHERSGVPASVGLGLTVSRQLARLMGGDLTYLAAAGRSTFRLTLPSKRHV